MPNNPNSSATPEAKPAPTAVQKGLAREARARFLKQLMPLLDPLAIALAQHMEDAVISARNAREAQYKRDALSLYNVGSGAWVAGVRSAWTEMLTPAESPTTTSAAPKAEIGMSDLSLLGDDAMDNNVLGSRIAQAISDKMGDHFEDFRLRMEHLEGAELSPADGLRVGSLTQVLVSQWVNAGFERDTLASLLKPMQGQLAVALPRQYQLMNEWLISQGVLPKMDLAARVKRTPSSETADSGGRGAGAASTPGELEETRMLTAMLPMLRGQMKAQGVLGNLKRLFAEHLGAGGAGTGRVGGALGALLGGGGFLEQASARPSGAGGMSGSGGASGSGAGVGSGPGSAGAAYAGGGMAAGGAGAVGAAAAPPGSVQVMVSPELAQALAALARNAPKDTSGGPDSSASTVKLDLSPAGLAKVAEGARQQTAALKQGTSNSGEKATIEVVALMFQSILAEDRIPASIRVWFSRLQLPVLRVALSDPEFFGSTDHPARSLIDRMGSCVLGFDNAAISGSDLEKEIRRVVQVIEQYPETGRRVFELVLGEFTTFLNKYLSGRGVAGKVISIAQAVEQKEALAIQYTIEMRDLLKDVPVRDEVREFLFKIWAEVLAVAAVRQGPKHADTQMFKKGASDLVWAASAKPNRADRAKVIQDLPRLLKVLRQGMAVLGLAGGVQEAHIKVISDTLADAFLSKTDAIAPAVLEAMARRLEHLDDIVADESMQDMDLEPEDIEMMLGIDASNIRVVADGGSRPGEGMVAWANELVVGTWFTLEHNGQVNRVQFAWRSPARQLHLFAATDGLCYLIQMKRLASYLQAGLLLPEEEESLTLRATRVALNKLEANPERLLA